MLSYSFDNIGMLISVDVQISLDVQIVAIAAIKYSTYHNMLSHMLSHKYVDQLENIFSGRIHVRIYNHLDGNQSVTVHCKSKDDDLKIHVIHANESYGWSFTLNYPGTTLFFCHFSWTGGAGTYDIYKGKRDYNNRCKFHCEWYVTKDGIEGTRMNKYSQRRENECKIWILSGNNQLKGKRSCN